MQEPRRPAFPWGLAAGNLFALALGLAVAAENLWKWREGSRAEVSGLVALPSGAGYGALTLAVAGAAGAALFALARRRPPGHRAYRLLPIAAAIAVFAHAFVLPQVEPAFPSNQIALTQMAMARDFLSAGQSLPAEPGPVEEAFQDMRPPYLVRGAPLARWTVLSRRDCAGPWLELPAGVRAGTILYCLSAKGDEAWMTAVGLGEGQFGEPSVVKMRGQPQVARLEPSAGNGPATPGAMPMQDDLPPGGSARAPEPGAAHSP